MNEHQDKDESGAAAVAGADQQRLDVIQGLRELADFLETNAEVPTPTHVWARHYYYKTSRADLRPGEAFRLDVAALGGTVAVDGSDVDATRKFSGGVEIELTIPAREVCVEREVTKTELVLPEELAPREPASEHPPADTTAVTW